MYEDLLLLNQNCWSLIERIILKIFHVKSFFYSLAISFHYFTRISTTLHGSQLSSDESYFMLQDSFPPHDFQIEVDFSYEFDKLYYTYAIYLWFSSSKHWICYDFDVNKPYIWLVLINSDFTRHCIYARTWNVSIPPLCWIKYNKMRCYFLVIINCGGWLGFSYAYMVLDNVGNKQ
jgi:hypothetical protein